VLRLAVLLQELKHQGVHLMDDAMEGGEEMKRIEGLMNIRSVSDCNPVKEA
jgi:hypothetical protein